MEKLDILDCKYVGKAEFMLFCDTENSAKNRSIIFKSLGEILPGISEINSEDIERFNKIKNGGIIRLPESKYIEIILDVYNDFIKSRKENGIINEEITNEELETIKQEFIERIKTI